MKILGCMDKDRNDVLTCCDIFSSGFSLFLNVETCIALILFSELLVLHGFSDLAAPLLIRGHNSTVQARVMLNMRQAKVPQHLVNQLIEISIPNITHIGNSYVLADKFGGRFEGNVPLSRKVV